VRTRKRIFGGWCLVVLGFYLTGAWRGWEVGAATAKRTLPREAQRSAGGYRPFIYWRGGK